MNNDQVKQIIAGIGVLSELWTITYQGFKRQGMNDDDAIKHTKALMSIMVDSFFDGNTKEAKDGD